MQVRVVHSPLPFAPYTHTHTAPPPLLPSRLTCMPHLARMQVRVAELWRARARIESTCCPYHREQTVAQPVLVSGLTQLQERILCTPYSVFEFPSRTHQSSSLLLHYSHPTTHTIATTTPPCH